jgi:hypothetical protein
MLNFTNQEILNSTLLSSMAYIEDRDIRGGELYLQQLVPISKTEEFLKNNNITIDTIKSVEELDSYVNLYLEEVRNLDLFKRVMGQKARFYQRFQEDLEIKYIPDESLSGEVKDKEFKFFYEVAKEDAIIETKKVIAQQIMKELKLLSPDFIKYKEEIDNTLTKLSNKESKHPNRKILNRDATELWQKFSPISFSKELKEKYKLYHPKNNSNIKATFSNLGYIDAAKRYNLGHREKLTKDASLLVGYIKENDQDVLYISFRGTEQKVKSALKYFLENYPNMERQYNYFEPILKDIISEEIKKHKELHPDKKLNIIFTGHSLGAALAEKALDKFQDDDNISYKGIFVSNPGSFHYLQNVVNKLDKFEYDIDRIRNSQFNNSKTKFLSLGADAISVGVQSLKATLLLGVAITSYLSGSVDIKIHHKEDEPGDYPPHLPDASKLKFYSDNLLPDIEKAILRFIAKGVASITKKVVAPIVDKKNADPRACTINHEQDNIPKIGRALFQNHNPQQVILTNLLPIDKSPSFFGKMFQIDYHGRDCYYAELKRLSIEGDIYQPKITQDKEPVLQRIKNLRYEFKDSEKSKNRMR